MGPSASWTLKQRTTVINPTGGIAAPKFAAFVDIPAAIVRPSG
jgi:hypothetical protein